MSKFLIFSDKQNHIVNMDEVVCIHVDTYENREIPKYYIEIRFKNNDTTYSLEYEDKELFNFDLRCLEGFAGGEE